MTSTQSGFSMNRWVHSQGTVEVFRAVTTRERAVKNEENLPKERVKHTHRKNEETYSPKELETYSPAYCW